MAATVSPSGSPAPGEPPRSSPASSQPTYADYVESQIDRTRDQLRLVELSAEGIALALFVVGYIALGVLADHWLIEGGLGRTGRVIACLGLFAGAALYFWLRILPWLVNRINPLYAAATIERAQPTIKNSLINFLFLRRTPPPPGVMHAVEQRAAADLAQAPVDSAVDRTRLLRAVFVLLGFTVLACGYKLVSPKDPFASVGRIVLPWADLAAPTRVAISDVTPGDAVAYVGDELTVKAKVAGVRVNEPVKAIFTTRDGATVERPVAMRKAETGNEYAVVLPDEPGGLTGDVDYYLAAGDVRTPSYHVAVRPAPTMVVTRVDLIFPAYTKYARETRRSGDFEAIEGTEIVLHGEANQDIAARSASIDFGCDGVSPYLVMESSGRTAHGKFVLSADPSARHETYLLQFRNGEGRKNPKPIRHRVGIIRDLAPVVAVVAPGKDVQIPANGSVLLHVKAEDPDFALASVELSLTTNTGKTLLKPAERKLLAEPHGGPWETRYLFSPATHNLKAGEVVTYKAIARDVKFPNANEVASEAFRIAIISPVAQPPQDQVADAGDARQNGGRQDGPPAANDPNQKRQDGPPRDGPKPEDRKTNDGPPAEPREPNQGPKDEGDKPQDQVAQNETPQGDGDILDKLADQLGVKNEAEKQVEQELNRQKPNEERGKNEGESGSVGGDRDGKNESSSGGENAQPGETDDDGKGPGQSGAKGQDLGEKEPGEAGEGDTPTGAERGPNGMKKPSDQRQAGDQSQGEPSPGEKNANGAGDQGDDPAGEPRGEKNANGQRPANPDERGPGDQNPGDKRPNERGPQDQKEPGEKGPRPDQQPGSEKQPNEGAGESGDPMPGSNEKPMDGAGGESGSSEPQNGGNRPEKDSGASRPGSQQPQDGAGQEQPGGGKPSGDDQPMDKGAGPGGGEQPMTGDQNPMGGAGEQPQDGTSQPGSGDGSKTPGRGSKPQSGDGRGQQGGSTPKNDAGRRGKPDQQPGDSGNAPAGSKPDANGDTRPSTNPAGQGDPNDPNARPSGEDPTGRDPQSAPRGQGQKPQNGDRRPNNDPGNDPDAPPQETDQAGGRGDGGQTKPAQQTPNGQKAPGERPDARGGDPMHEKGATGNAPPGQDDNGTSGPNEAPEKTRNDKTQEKPNDAGARRSDRDEANSHSVSKRESDGGKRQNDSGNLSGGGGEGGGEKGNQSGTGGAGSNTQSNEGSGQAPEAGDGAASNRPGDSRPSDKPTGQAGEERGNGSNSRENPNGNRPGSNDPRGKPAQNPADQSGDQPPQRGSGTEGNAPPNRDRQQTDSQRPSANGTPTGGGGQAADGKLPDGRVDGSSEPGGDPVNEKYTEKALDMVLEKLKDQLAKEKVDPELLKRSGFRSREELDAWVKQWDKLRQDARQSGELGAAAKRKLDERLRGLGLTRPSAPIESARTPGDAIRELREGSRVAPPAEYAEQADAYKSGVNRRLPQQRVD